MTWYYANAGQQAGPVDDDQLAALVRSGQILPETLVWHEGMANWQPYREVMPAPSAAALAPTVAPIVMPAHGAVCAECGVIFDIHDMIQFGGVHVCAKCKPIFMQKLAEGARLNTGTLSYAGFWTRFAAVFLDAIIMYIVSLVMNLAAGLSLRQSVGVQPATSMVLPLLLIMVQMLMGITYEVVMIGKFGATLGKMACKIMVVTPDGGQVSYLRAFGRYFAKILSGVPCALGYIIAAFDDQKRALHDRICDTRVVMK